MAVPSVNFTVDSTTVESVKPSGDVVFVVGPPGTGGTGAVGTLYYGDKLADFTGVVGTAGDVRDFIDALFSQVGVDLVYSPTAAAPTNTQIGAAIDLANDASKKPTILHVVGDLTAVSDATTVNAVATKLALVAGSLGCRAVANTPQDSAASAVAWGNNNGDGRLIGVFNQNKTGASSYKFPSGFWIGAALNVAANRGRAWGINFASVKGLAELRHDLAPYSSVLSSLDAAGVSAMVNDQGVERIIGDEFKADSATDPQRFWTIGRVVDHVQRTLEAQARLLIGSTRSADRMAIKLTMALNPIVHAGELVSGTVAADSARTQGATKYFKADLGLKYATNIVNVEFGFTV